MSTYEKIFPWCLHLKYTEGKLHEINVNDLYKMNSQFGFALKNVYSLYLNYVEKELGTPI